jgi:hypothetical protein
VCLAILVATDEPLDPPYVAEVGGIGVRPLPTADAFCGPFTKPHAYVVSMPSECGCVFRHPGESPRRALVWLLEWALRSAPEVELHARWDSDAPRDGTPAARDWSTAAELLYWRVFEGGEFLVVRRDAEPAAAPDPARESGSGSS